MRLTFVLGSVCCVSLSLAAQPAQTPRSWPTSPVPQAACRLDQASVAPPFLGAPGSQSVPIDCKSPAIARCDFANHEPLDVTAALVCNAAPVPVPAKPAILRSAQDLGAVVDWLTLTPDFKFLVVASRQVRLQPQTLVPVATAETTRWVRVSPAGGSPVTLPAASLSAEAGVEILSQVGGELVLGVPAASVRPDAIEISGRSIDLLPVDSRLLVTKPALFAGAYSAVPIYQGGLRGKPLQVTVEMARSTLAVLPAEPLGAIAIAADADICQKAQSIQIARQAGESRKAIYRNDNVSGCDWKVAGLPPGSYQVTAESADGTLAESAIEVKAQSWADARLSPSHIRVAGRISLNGKPASTMKLAFLGNAGNPTVVDTDTTGSYSVALPEKGSYGIQLRSLPLLGTQNVTRVFNQLTNTFDWDLKGGVIAIEFAGWFEPMPIQLMIDGPTRTAGIVTRDDLPPGQKAITIYGLQLGDYKVTASLPNGKVSKSPQEARLTDIKPDARVTVELIENSGELVVRDPAGNPVSGARILAGARRLNEQSPGVYSLKAVAPGTPMVVTAAGFVPTCVLAVANVTNGASLVVPDGLPIELVFPKPVSFPPGSFSGLPGATCPVPASTFTWTIGSRDASSTSVRFSNLFQTQGLTYDPGGLPQRVVTGADGRMVVRLPGIIHFN